MGAPPSGWRDGSPALATGPGEKRELSAALGSEQEVAQAIGDFVRPLFGDEVAGVHAQALDLAGALRAPQRQRLVEAADDAVLAPQHERVAGDLLAAGARGALVIEIDRR